MGRPPENTAPPAQRATGADAPAGTPERATGDGATADAPAGLHAGTPDTTRTPEDSQASARVADPAEPRPSDPAEPRAGDPAEARAGEPRAGEPAGPQAGGPAEPPAGGKPPAKRRALGVESLAAAILAAAVFIAAGLFRGTFPFGSASRSTNDLGAQYIPFYAHLWDIVHGRAQGDLLFNWQSGYGVGFLADFGVVLGSPLSFLVALFPRDQVDLAVFVLTTLKLALAAIAMTVLLRSVKQGPRWLAPLLGASYALCGWAIDDAAYVPMWLDGLIALPLFCLVGEWSLRRTHQLASILVVAVFWVANFYTAYMATIAAGLVLLIRLATGNEGVTGSLRVLVRHAVSVLLGLGLAAPVLWPVIAANRIAAPSPPGVFVPIPAQEFLSRLLPLSEGVGRSPSLSVGTVALLLACTLPFNRAVPLRTRLGWVVLTAAIAGSFVWAPTQALWHGFDTPNGSQYREAFVLCGVLVVAAWLSFAHRVPGPVPLALAAVLVAVIGWIAAGSRFLDRSSILVLACAGALTVLATAALWWSRRSGSRPRVPALAAFAVLLVIVAIEATWSAVVTDAQRATILSANARPWEDKHRTLRELVEQGDGWPRYRTNPDSHATHNDPLLIGGQGPSYYSSLHPASLNRTMTELGFGWVGYGRSTHDLDHPVIDALFAVGARVRSDGAGGYRLDRLAAPPLVTIRRRLTGPDGSSAYAAQERLLGAKVYDTPRYRGSKSTTGGDIKLVGRCRPGWSVYLHLPRFAAEARLGDTGEWRTTAPAARLGQNTSGAMVGLGKVPPSGEVRIELKPLRGLRGLTPREAIGCLNTDELARQVRRVSSTAATEVQATGHSIRATLRPESTGYAVVAVPRLPGWRCSMNNGKSVQPRDFGGLMAIRLPENPRTLACTYVPPGLRQGAGLATLALVVVLALAGFSFVRRRRLRS